MREVYGLRGCTYSPRPVSRPGGRWNEKRPNSWIGGRIPVERAMPVGRSPGPDRLVGIPMSRTSSGTSGTESCAG